MDRKGMWTKVSGWPLLHRFSYEIQSKPEYHLMESSWWVMVCGRQFRPQPDSNFTEEGSKCLACALNRGR